MFELYRVPLLQVQLQTRTQKTWHAYEDISSENRKSPVGGS